MCCSIPGRSELLIITNSFYLKGGALPHPNIKNNGIKNEKNVLNVKIEKELSIFVKIKVKKTGLSSYCRQCSCESDEIYRNTHKLKVAKRHEKIS